MSEPVRIPVSIFELTADYTQPDFRLWSDRASVIQGVFTTLTKWGASIDGVETVTTGPASQQGFLIKLPSFGVTFFFGAAACRFTKQNADWATADETFAIMDAALSALVSHATVTLRAYNAAILLHLQLQRKSVRFLDLLEPFISSKFSAIEKESPSNMAVILRWPHRQVTFEGSALFANAIYLRFDRELPATLSYNEMAAQLRKDRDDLFSMLGVQEDGQ